MRGKDGLVEEVVVDDGVCEWWATTGEFWVVKRPNVEG